jgi:predicted acylesterase/phospholipase RssA
MQTKRRIPFALLMLLALSSGCAGERPPRTQEQLISARQVRDAQTETLINEVVKQAVEAAAAKSDQTGQPPVIDILIISGGGDWGAFGAGFLNGWSRLQGPLAMPKFDGVTGVSTGALIAPFAFLGDPASLERVENLYRNPQKDWVKKRWPLYFLPSNQSFATTPGLEREVRASLPPDMVVRIAEESKRGRLLLIGTTDLDDGCPFVWNLGEEAETAVLSGDIERVDQILLASAGIPAAFPFREIDGNLFVDGGVTGNILYGGRVEHGESIPAVWAATYPTRPMVKVREWVIFNNQLRPRPQVTAPTWPAVVARSLDVSTRSATLTAMRHLFAQAEILRLRHGGEVEVRVVAIPNSFIPPVEGTFQKETMNALSDLGERMGADPSSWLTEVP